MDPKHATTSSLWAEMDRQREWFTEELRKQSAEISVLRRECEQRAADCESLQCTVGTLATTVDWLAATLEQVRGSRSEADDQASQPAARSASSVWGANGRPWRAAPTQSPRRRRRDASPGGSSSGPIRRRVTRSRSQSPALVTSPGGTGPLSGYGGLSPDPHYMRMSPSRRGPRRSVSRTSATGASATGSPPPPESSLHPAPPPGLSPPPGHRSVTHQLKPHAVAGCTVDGYASCIAYADAGALAVYAAGCVAVSHELASAKQKFFTRHTAPLNCVVPHPLRARLVLTSQRSGQGSDVFVWDARLLDVLGELKTPESAGGVLCAGFSADGVRIAVVTADSRMMVYHWEKKLLLCTAHTGSSLAYGVAFSPFKDGMDVLVYGLRSITHWQLQQGPEWTATRHATLRLGEPSPRVTAAVWIRGGAVVAGTDAGSLLVFRDGDLLHTTADVHPGGVSAVSTIGGGIGSAAAVALVTAGRDGSVLLWRRDQLAHMLSPSAAKRSPDVALDVAERIKEAQLRDSSARALRPASSGGGAAGGTGAVFSTSLSTLAHVTGGKAPVRAMAVRPAPGYGASPQEIRVVCVLFSNQIAELAVGSQQFASVLQQGHSALPGGTLAVADDPSALDATFQNAVSGISVHPTLPVAATVGSDATLRLWRTAPAPPLPPLQPLNITALPAAGTCVAFSTHDGGRLLAAGHVGDGQSGGVSVYSLPDASGRAGCSSLYAEYVPVGRCGESTAQAVRFCPIGKHLAVAFENAGISLFAVPKHLQQQQGRVRASAAAWQRVVSVDTAAPVQAVDWSVDGGHFATTDAAEVSSVWRADGRLVDGPGDVQWACLPAAELHGALKEASVSDPTPCSRAHGGNVVAAAFSRNAPRLLLSGGADGCLLAWQVHRE